MAGSRLPLCMHFHASVSENTYVFVCLHSGEGKVVERKRNSKIQ